MRRITASLESDRPMLLEVLHYLVTNAGMEVVCRGIFRCLGSTLFDGEFLWALDRLKEPGIVSHLLQEFPDLKVVVVSPDHFTISDVGTRTRQFSDLSMDSIRSSIVESLT